MIEITIDDVRKAYERGVKAGHDALWQKYPGNIPPKNGEYLVTVVLEKQAQQVDLDDVIRVVKACKTRDDFAEKLRAVPKYVSTRTKREKRVTTAYWSETLGGYMWENADGEVIAWAECPKPSED